MLHTTTLAMPASAPTARLRRLSVPPAPRPWTLAETLGMIRTRRLTLVETSRGLRIRHRHRHDLPGLDDALATYAPVLRIWQAVGTDAEAAAAGWDEATSLFASWFRQRFVAPLSGFALRPGCVVRDGQRYRASVLGRLRLGPGRPGAEDLPSELAALFVRFALSRAPASGHERRRAA